MDKFIGVPKYDEAGNKLDLNTWYDQIRVTIVWAKENNLDYVVRTLEREITDEITRGM